MQRPSTAALGLAAVALALCLLVFVFQQRPEPEPEPEPVARTILYSGDIDIVKKMASASGSSSRAKRERLAVIVPFRDGADALSQGDGRLQQAREFSDYM